MKINFDQILANLLLLLFIAVILESVIASIFNIRITQDFLRTSIGQTIKTAFIFLVAFGLCSRINELRLFHQSGLKVPSFVDYVVTSLFLVRLTNLIHDFFQYIKKRSLEG